MHRNGVKFAALYYFINILHCVVFYCGILSHYSYDKYVNVIVDICIRGA